MPSKHKTTKQLSRNIKQKTGIAQSYPWYPLLRILIFLLFLPIFSLILQDPALSKEIERENSESELESILEGFDDESSEIIDRHKLIKERVWDFSGFLTLGSSYNYSHKAPLPGKTDYRGLSRLRIKFFLGLDLFLPFQWKSKITGDGFYDFAYQIKGRSQFTKELLDQQEKEFKLGEGYVQGNLFSNLDLKIGRQMVVWGKSDNIRITDILNPLDNRDPGMVDIENLRLPVAMSMLNYYLGSWDLSVILILEKRFDKNPAFGSDFNSLSFPTPEEKNPDGTEYAVALNGIFSGWDIAFYGARVFENKPHFVMENGLKLKHSQLWMGGFATNLVYNNFLFKTEGAWFYGLKFFNLPSKKKSRYDALVGIEFQGFANQVISFELANQHILKFKNVLKKMPDFAKENEFQTAIRYSGDFKHDRLHLLFLASIFGIKFDGGGFQRISLEYDLYDSLSITCGVINYDSGNLALLRNIGNNDRAFFDIKYSF